MANYTIADSKTQGIVIAGGDIVTVNAGASIIDPTVNLTDVQDLDLFAGIEDRTRGTNTIRVSGTVKGFVGVWLRDGADNIRVQAGGLIYGANAGIEVHVSGHSKIAVASGGTIASNSYGVYFGAPPHKDVTQYPQAGFNTIDNDGVITAVHREAVRFVFGGNLIDNTGTISSTLSEAIHIDSFVTDHRNKIINSGAIDGGHSRVAIVSGDASMTIQNSGHIKGDIDLGAGNDIYGGGGTVDGTINGGGGNDHLVGGAGNDVLCGGLGTDILHGGGGSDTFVYNAVAESTQGKGVDTIDGFSFGHDHLMIQGTEIASFDHIAAMKDLTPDHAAVIENRAGQWFIAVDENGVAGYQAGADYLIALTHPSHVPV